MLYSIFLGGIFNLVIALVLIVSNQTEKLRAERKERESLEGASISSKWDFSCCELLEQLEVRYFIFFPKSDFPKSLKPLQIGHLSIF